MPIRLSVEHLFAAATVLAAVGAHAAHATPRTEVLFSFSGADGSDPSDLTADAAGVLYGTTQGGGGAKQCRYGCGTIFRLVPPAADGMPWKHETLYTFTGQADGSQPSDRPILDAQGNLYGTTIAAGDLPYNNKNGALSGGGVLWELSPPGVAGGAWTYQVLHTFTGQSGGGSQDGYAPIGRLVLSSGGVLYGTTHNGGTAKHAAGIAYALSPPATENDAWTETILHDFDDTDGQGGKPLLLTGHETELLGFGPTYYRSHDGTTFGVLYDLRLGPQGATFGVRGLTQTAVLSGGPILYRNHALVYGAFLVNGNASGGGIIEAVPPAKPGAGWGQTVLHTFHQSSGQGYNPNGTLLATASGTLFGTTTRSGSGGGTADGSAGPSGAVFRLDPPQDGGTVWTYTELHQFDGDPGTDGGRPDGALPNGALTFGRHHQLYGATTTGGRYGHGTIFMQVWQ